MTWLAMGGYALVVWSSYALSVVVLAVLAIASLRALRRGRAAAQRLEKTAAVAPRNPRAASMAVRFVPLILFLALGAVFAAVLLSGDPRLLPSALIGKPAPEFDLPPLDGTDRPGLSGDDLRRGEVTLVNVWASWCGPCRAEHPLLAELAARPDITVAGINYKDAPDRALRFLEELGNPYARIGVDQQGRAGLDWGIYGIPETFVVNGSGRIVLRHAGPIDRTIMAQEIIPALDTALAAGSQP